MDTELTPLRSPLDLLTFAGYDAYLCGGCVRDSLLGRVPKDVDIATNALPDAVIEVLTQYGYRPSFVGESFGVVLVVTPFGACEIATYRRDGVYTDGRRPDEVAFSTQVSVDAKRRDFTINAMYLDQWGYMHEWDSGKVDCADRIIRCVGNPSERFHEDKLRMLRAVRFACQLGFTIEPATFMAIQMLAVEITTVSPERIGNELLAAFTADPERALFLLDQTGLLRWVLPEIDAMHGVTHDEVYHPEGDVFVHTSKVLHYLGTLPKAWRDEVTVWSCLFHDVAKPETREEFPETGRIKFIGHEDLGATKVRDILNFRLRRSAETVDRVSWMIANHLKPGRAAQYRLAKLKRLLAHDDARKLLVLAWCDSMGGYRGDIQNLRICRDLLRRGLVEPEVLKPVRLVTGHDLIALGMSPGREMGRVLDEIKDAQLEGKITTKEEALAMVTIGAFQ